MKIENGTTEKLITEPIVHIVLNEYEARKLGEIARLVGINWVNSGWSTEAIEIIGQLKDL